MRPRPFTLIFLLASVAGLYFAGYSTYDFIQHLDRQVHSIACSFVPGLAEADATGSSGCHATMMSAYSSVLRTTVWGGLPISLPGFAVFAYLLFRGLDLVLNRREDDRGATGFLALAALLPLLTSCVMGYLSLVELGAACKLCIGIYTSSAVAFVAAVLNWRAAAAPRLGETIGLTGEPSPGEGQGMRGHVFSFAEGVGFVLVPSLVYLVAMPDYSGFIGTCGSLAKPEDPYAVMVPVGQQAAGEDTIEVFDPLCPACRAVEGRLASSGLDQKLKRKALLFPLDSTCNWMVGSSLHPGACTVSEAVLCAGTKADAVIAWAFDHQDEVKKAAAQDPALASKMVGDAFPELKSCIGTPGVKSKLNKSLRWAVANQLPVLTPQIYVNGTKLCDEDTDLGMDYALTRLVSKAPAAAPKE